MLYTTVYNQANAVITGCYYDPKGNKIDVEYMGSALECECYVRAIQSDNDRSNEVTEVINHVNVNVNVKCATPVYTGFALHGVWGAVVSSVVGA